MSMNYSFFCCELDVILKAELLHFLGNDILAGQEIRNLGNSLTDNDLKKRFIVLVRSALRNFYSLESTKHSSTKKKNTKDIQIDYRQKLYKLVLKKLDDSILILIKIEFSEQLESNRLNDISRKNKSKENQKSSPNIEEVENTVIYEYYNTILSKLQFLNTIFKEFNNPKELDAISDLSFDRRDIERFYSELDFSDTDVEYLKRKIQAKCYRFEKDDRSLYWENLYRKQNEKKTYNQTIDQVIGEHFKTSFLDNSFVGLFVIIILIKYHIRSHNISEGKQYSIFHRDINKNYALLESYTSYKEELERCQKIFTFVRLISKYYPEIYWQFGEPRFAELFQAIAYLRRGNTFFLQENYTKAFNDYNYAQNYLDTLKCEGKNQFDEFLLSYKYIIEAICIGSKGECYRQDYDYETAYRYYRQSVDLFNGIPDIFEKYDAITIFVDENWEEIINFGLRYNIRLIDIAKMFLVKGDFRSSLKWYLLCLKNLFALFVRANNQNIKFSRNKHQNDSLLFKIINETISYLDETKNKATIKKRILTNIIDELSNCTEEFIYTNLDLFLKKCMVTALLSDIFNRISMLLYLISLPNVMSPVKHECSSKWLSMAIELNPFNGLAHYNLLIYKLLEDNSESFIFSNRYLSPEDYLKLQYDGALFDQFNRHFATWALQSVDHSENTGNSYSEVHTKNKKGEIQEKIARNLLSRMFQYTDNYSLRNKEMFKYLNRERTLQNNKETISKLFVLRRWSSFTPAVPRPTTFHNRGGGYFVIHKGKGIAIDPGFDFTINLYQEGFSVNDIDSVIITHDHIDHHADFDTLLTLWHLNRTYNNQRLIKNIYLPTSLIGRFSFLLSKSYDFNVFPLKSGSKLYSNNSEYDYSIDVKEAIHKDLSSEKYSIGFILNLLDNGKQVFAIGFTGDSKYLPSIIRQYIECDVILFNISSLPFRELKHFIPFNNQNSEYSKKLKDLLALLENNSYQNESNNTFTNPKMIANQLCQSFSYHHKNDKSIEKMFQNEYGKKYSDLKMGEHLYLKGILELNNILLSEQKSSSKQKLIIITEFKEEIGSFRTKIADELNNANPKECTIKYLTGDIGLTVKFQPFDSSQAINYPIQIGCSRCKLNNDYLHHDIFHPIDHIDNFCIRGENEGVFYLCKHHSHSKNLDSNSIKINDEVFYLKLERYNVFG